ncbi:hypothetical protein AT959_02640 [Dechloromonas denitrificans]|uniref:Uncharacterized protein n=1 Tax=Dechloromonas denitrificans TaxID=281362 RepID=A0A133XM20_9RHOO|nr:hypothetical protein AT959_02640 [Dechloromonas denitrificans]
MLEFGGKFCQIDPLPRTTRIFENDVWGIGATPFVVGEAEIGLSYQIGGIVLDVERQYIEIGATKFWTIVAFPGHGLSGLEQLETNRVFPDRTALPNFMLTAIGLRALNNDLLPIVQQDFLLPTVAA